MGGLQPCFDAQENGKTGASGKTRAPATTAMAVMAAIASTAMTTKVRRRQVDPRMVLAELLISVAASCTYCCTFHPKAVR